MILNFIESKHANHKRPVAKTAEGKLAVIDGKSSNSKKVKIGEIWDCLLVEEKPNFIIVNPVKITENKGKNTDVFKNKILALKEKWGVAK